MKKKYIDQFKQKKGCTKKYADVFDNLIREITLHLPKLNKLGFFIQAISQTQILTLMFELFYNIHKLKDEQLDNALYSNLKIFYDFINFRNLFDNHTINIMNSIACSTIIFYDIILFIVSLVFGIFIFFDKSFYDWLSKIWGHLCIWHHSVICVPTFGYSVKMIVDYQNGNLRLFKENNPALIWIIILLMLGAIFSLISALIMSKLCYHQLKVKDSNAMKDSNLQVITLVIKIILTSILSMPNSNMNSLLGVIVSTSAITTRKIFILLYLPFYNFRMANYYTIANTLIMNIAIMCLLSFILNNYIQFSPLCYLITAIIMFPLHAMVSKNIIDNKILQSATLPYSQIKSDSQIILKWLYFKRLIRKGAPNLFSFKKILNYEMFLQGIFMEHCENEGRIYLKKYGLEDSFDKNFKKLGEMSSDNYDQLAFIIRKLVLKIGMEKFPDSHLIRLLMVQSIIDRTELYHQSIFILNDLKSRSQTLETKNSISQLEKRMEQILETKCYITSESNTEKIAKEINILQLMKNEEIYVTLNNELQKQTKLHMKFWGLFIENEPKIRDIYNLAIKIHKDTLNLKNQWEKLVNKCQRSQPKIFLLYGLFNLIVKNRNILGEDLLKTYTNIVKNTHNQDLSDSLSSDNILAFDNIVLLVSGQKENLGIIKTVTQSVEKHIGIPADSLKGINITSLMSPYFKKNHDSFILNYYHTGEATVFKSHRVIFLMDKNGYIIPSNIIVRYSPSLINGVEFFSVIRPHKSNRNLILLTQDGIIDSCTKKIGDLLNLKNISTKAMRISAICPEFEEINEIINQHEIMKLSAEAQKERDEIMSVRTAVTSYHLKKDFNNSNKYYSTTIHNNKTDEDRNLLATQLQCDANQNQKNSQANEELIPISKATEQNLLIAQGGWHDYIMESEKKNIGNSDIDDFDQKYSIQKISAIANIYSKSQNSINHMGQSKILAKNQLQIESGGITNKQNVESTKITSRKRSIHGGQGTRIKPNENQIKELFEKYVSNNNILQFHGLNIDSQMDSILYKCKIKIEIHQKSHVFKILELTKPTLYNFKRFNTNMQKTYNQDEQNNSQKCLPFNNGYINSEMYLTRNINLEISEGNANSNVQDLFYAEEKKNGENDSFENEFPMEIEQNNSNKVVGTKNLLQISKNIPRKTKTKTYFSQQHANGQWYFDGPVPDNKNDSSNQSKKVSNLKDSVAEKILVNKREKKVRRIGGGGEEENTSYNSSNQTRSSHYIMMKIESALDEDFRTNSLRLIYYGTTIFYTACLILLIISISYNMSGIKSMANKREIIELANFRVDSLDEVYKNAIILYENISNITDYSWVTNKSILSYIEANPNKFASSCINLAYYNNELRNLLYEIDANLKNKFYLTQAKTYYFNDQGDNLDTYLEQNIFDATLSIVARCFNLANTNWSTLNPKNRDLAFILKNSLNDILLGIEESTSILAQDIDISMEAVLMTNLGFLVSMSLCISALYILLAKHMHNFNLERENFFTVLLKINMTDLKLIYARLTKFNEILRKNYQDHDLIVFFNLLQKNNADNTGKKGDPNRKIARTAQFQGLNRKNLLILLGAFILVGVIFTVFSTIYIELNEFNNTRKIQINKGNYADFSLIRYGQAILSLTDYILYNSTSTMRNQNISISIEENLNNLNYSRDILEQFTDNNGNLDPDFSFYLTENFCLFGQDYQRSYCGLIDSTPVQMGIIGINNYITSKLINIKQAFDGSERSDIDIKKVLNNNDFFNINAIYSIYMREAYIRISSILKIDFRLEVERVQNTLIILAVCFVCLIILAGIISKICVYNTLKQQGNSLKGILKLLPLNLLLSNSALKFYMMKTSKKILDSLKINL